MHYSLSLFALCTISSIRALPFWNVEELQAQAQIETRTLPGVDNDFDVSFRERDTEHSEFDSHMTGMNEARYRNQRTDSTPVLTSSSSLEQTNTSKKLSLSQAASSVAALEASLKQLKGTGDTTNFDSNIKRTVSPPIDNLVLIKPRVT
jgi:hypothetical protein